MTAGIFIFLFFTFLAFGLGMIMRNKAPAPKRRRLWRTMAVLSLVLGLLLIIVGAAELFGTIEARSWPITEGVVLSSTVAGSKAFHPEVTYIYSVNGKSHLATSYLGMPGFGGKRNRLDAAEKIIAQYPPGTAVTVHYDPDNPARSELRVGPAYDTCLHIALGLLLYSVSVIILVPLLFGTKIQK